MLVIKHVPSGLYFVGDNMCWSRNLEDAVFFHEPEDAEKTLNERLPNNNKDNCLFLRMIFSCGRNEYAKLMWSQLIKEDDEWKEA